MPNSNPINVRQNGVKIVSRLNLKCIMKLHVLSKYEAKSLNIAILKPA